MINSDTFCHYKFASRFVKNGIKNPGIMAHDSKCLWQMKIPKKYTNCFIFPFFMDLFEYKMNGDSMCTFLWQVVTKCNQNKEESAKHYTFFDIIMDNAEIHGKMLIF